MQKVAELIEMQDLATENATEDAVGKLKIIKELQRKQARMLLQIDGLEKIKAIRESTEETAHRKNELEEQVKYTATKLSDSYLKKEELERIEEQERFAEEGNERN